MDGMDNWVVMGRGAHPDTHCHCDSTLKTDDFKKKILICSSFQRVNHP